MSNLQQYKIVQGTENTDIYEDPVKGSNGTAVVVKINKLIDALQTQFLEATPTNKGNIVTRDSSQSIVQLLPGSDGFCLVSDPNNPKGLTYEERVDLISDQQIGGKKTFVDAPVFSNGFTANGAVQFNSNLTVAGDITGQDIRATGSVLVQGNTTLNNALTVGGAADFNNNLNVDGISTLRGNVSMDNALNVVGSTTLGNALNVAGSTTLDGVLLAKSTVTLKGIVTANQDLSVGEDLSVTNHANIGGNLNVQGTVNFNGGVALNQDLTLQGTITSKGLSVDGSANITGSTTLGGTLTVAGNINTNSNISTAGNLSVNNDASILGDADVSGVLNVGGAASFSSGITVTGMTSLSQLDLAGALEVDSNALVRGTLRVLGNTTLESPVTIQSTLQTTNSVQIGSTLTTNGSITSGGGVHSTGILSTDSNATVDGSITAGGNIETTASVKSGFINVANNATVVGKVTAGSIETSGNITGSGDATISGRIQATSGNFNSLEVTGNTNLLSDVAIGGDLSVNGNFTSNNLSGTNTGDEVPATPAVFGLVKTEAMDLNPIVYTKARVDSLFLPISEKASPNGLASLDANGTIPASQLPASATTVPITSVFSRTGVITAQSGDYTATQISFSTTSNLLANNTRDAIEELKINLGQDIQTHVSDTNNPHNVTTAQIGAIPIAQKGAANGVASLDNTSKVPLSQLPDTILGTVKFQSTWNAVTNTPAITSGVGNKGNYYVVSTKGNTLVDGQSDWEVGDWIIFNGSAWEKVDNTDRISSVFGRSGNITAQSGDYSSDLITNDSLVVGLSVTEALDTLNNNKAALNHLHSWADIHSTPTTLAGYGITDAVHNSLLGAPGGVATLDSNGKLDNSQAHITSVFGRTGVVIPQSNDYSANQVSFASTTTLASTNVRDALEELHANTNNHTSRTDNPHSVTYTQVGAIPLTDRGAASGVAPLDSSAKIPDTFINPDFVKKSEVRFTKQFSDADLTSNNLTVTHSLGYQFPSAVNVWSGGNKMVIPDEVLAVSENELNINLTSFVPLTGTWKVEIRK